MQLLNWKNIAGNFINRVNQWNGDKSGHHFLSQAIDLLRDITGAYTSLQIVFEDKLTAKVKDATPSFLDELVLNPVPVTQLLQTHQYQPFCWSEIPVKHNVFQELLTALSSAAVIPLNYNGKLALILLGWSEPHSFDAEFSEAAIIIKSAVENAMSQNSKADVLQRTNACLTAILEAMPQAVIFIDDNGYSGWINKQAARLLKLPMSGELPPSEFAGAMAQWRNSAANSVEINQKAMQFFSQPDSVIKDWIWKFSLPEPITYSVSCTPVKSPLFTGKLWVFDNITAVIV